MDCGPWASLVGGFEFVGGVAELGEDAGAGDTQLDLLQRDAELLRFALWDRVRPVEADAAVGRVGVQHAEHVRGVEDQLAEPFEPGPVGQPLLLRLREQAERRHEDLIERLERRMKELEQERQITAAPPVIVGRALIAPVGLLLDEIPRELLDTRITEAIAMKAVMEAEIALGNEPRDVSKEKVGYDIESVDGRSHTLRFIEVKGRRAGAETGTVTHNEIMRALNEPEKFILALVEVADGKARAIRYVRKPFVREPDRYVNSVNYEIKQLLAISEEPG